MEHNENQGLLTRRGVLKSIGLAGAAAISSPFVHAGESAIKAATLKTSSGTKVGLLLPASGAEGYSSSFINGFYLSLSSQKGAATFAPVTEQIGAGDSAYSKLLKLVKEDNIDVVAALVNSRVSQTLVREVEQAGIQIIEANLGENFFHKDYASDKFFQVSLNLWQAHYVLGSWAAANLGKKAVCASSFFDSGYDALYAFRAGFESAGGTVSDMLISGNPSSNQSPVEIAALAAHSESEIIFVNYSGHDAALFLSAFKASGASASKKILASGMMTQPRILKIAGNEAIGIYSAHTWHLESSQASAAFGAAYRTKYNQEADDFAVLGYDTAGVLSAAIAKSNGFSRESSLKSAMEGMKYSSARGSLTINAGTHASESPVFITQVARPDDLHILAKIELPSAITNAKFRLTDDLRSGAVMLYPAM